MSDKRRGDGRQPKATDLGTVKEVQRRCGNRSDFDAVMAGCGGEEVGWVGVAGGGGSHKMRSGREITDGERNEVRQVKWADKSEAQCPMGVGWVGRWRGRLNQRKMPRWRRKRRRAGGCRELGQMFIIPLHVFSISTFSSSFFHTSASSSFIFSFTKF